MPSEAVILKIGSNKAPDYARRVAGAMTWQLREHGMFRARAVKSRAVSVAVSSIATCNKRVAAAGVVLSVEPSFSATEEARSNAIEMVVKESESERPAEMLEYKVSGKRRYDKNLAVKLAEALAVPARGGKGIVMKCIGAAAAYRAMLGATMARGLIYPNGMDAVVVPFWETIIEENGSNTSVLLLEFWPKKRMDS